MARSLLGAQAQPTPEAPAPRRALRARSKSAEACEARPDMKVGPRRDDRCVATRSLVDLTA